MRNDFDWLARLNRDRKGIWGVLSQYDSVRGGSCISLSTPSDFEKKEIDILIDDDKTLFKDNENIFYELDLAKLAKEISNSAVATERSSVRVIINDFHIANEVEQSMLIKTARSIQEENSDISFQFIFCGNWSYFSFCDYYTNTHGKTSSPAAEYKNILYVPEKNSNDVLDMLISSSLVAQPTELDEIACNLLIEKTYGNDFLVDKALEYLRDERGSWIDNIEPVLEKLVVAPDVIESIKGKVLLLDSACKSELQKLLRVHRAVRSNDSIITEKLWLSGLVKRTNLKNNKQLIQVSGALVNSVLRNIASDVGLDCCAHATDLCLDGTTISSFAYNKVAEIENLLRCLVVSEWYIEDGDSWPENLNKIKTPAFERQEQEDLIKLVLGCMKQEFPALNQKTENTRELAEASGNSRPKRKHEGLFESAKNWQKRQEEHHGIDLARNNVMHFLTTENLDKVLVDKKVGLAREGAVFNKINLQSTLDEYKAIRSAIAHNQPITLTTINRLDAIMDRITGWITTYVDNIS
ncbi:hypothetical protein BCT62_03175 [Vibrio splendidus]|uniref:hypothetical protein n=1 Tax=Vibrio splendidus TaxID=29497 RepID=UPI000C820846|nr:hypothetical protein [Vibrio splendidus]PMM08334.1 hypothetical protein BCT62_03175 [Vibrio splendidus]